MTGMDAREHDPNGATGVSRANLVAGKQKVTVKFQANGNGRIAPVFGVRVVRN